MTELQILDIMYQTFQTAVKLTMPFLLISMIVGVVIAINEQTLTFVPKFLAILVVMGLLGSTLLGTLQDFFRQMLAIIVGS